MLATEYEATFNQVWDYKNAFRASQYFFRNSFARSRHDRVQNNDGSLETVDGIFAGGTGKRRCAEYAITLIKSSDIVSFMKVVL